MIEAKEAKEWGLVNSEQLAMDLARKIGNNSAMANRLAKEVLNQAVNESFEQTLKREEKDAIIMRIKSD